MKNRKLVISLTGAAAVAAAAFLILPKFLPQNPEPLRPSASHAEVRVEDDQIAMQSTSGDQFQPNQIEVNNNVISTRSIVHEADESSLDASLLEEFLSKRLVASYRVVTVDTDSLREFLRGDTDIDGPLIELVDGYAVRIKTQIAENHSSGWQNGMATWVGKIVGDEFGGATFVIAPDGGLDATITSSKGRYRIEGVGLNPYHVVWRMDTNDPYPID